LTPQTSLTTYTFTNEDITQPDDEDWTFEDVTLTFPSSKTMTITAGLEIDNSTINGNATWDFELASGSSTTLKNATINGGNMSVAGSLTLDHFNEMNEVQMTIASGLDFTVPSSDTLVFNNGTISFASGRRLNVYGGFKASSSAFTRDTTWTWWGMDLDAASVDTLRDIYFDGDSLHVHTNSLVLDGYNTVYGTGILIPQGVTLTIPTGVTLKLGGHQANPSQIIVHGTLNVDGYIACSTASEVIADGGTVNGKGNIEMGCINACMLARNGGTLRFFAGSTTTVGSSAFLANESGTFILEDNATITYESTHDLLLDPGTTVKLGENAKIILKKPVTLSGSISQPIHFEPLTTGVAWNQIKVEATAAGSSFDYIEVSGATYGLGILADNVSVSHSSFSDNGTGILVTDFAHAVIEPGNMIEDNTQAGITVRDDATAEITGNTIQNNAGPGVNILYGGTAELTHNTLLGNKHGLYLLQADDITVFTRNTVEQSDEHGLYVGPMSTLYMDTGSGPCNAAGAACNAIRYNTKHEVYLSSASSRLYAGDTATGPGGYNDIYDSSYGTGNYYIYNRAIEGEDIFWEVPAMNTIGGRPRQSVACSTAW